MALPCALSLQPPLPQVGANRRRNDVHLNWFPAIDHCQTLQGNTRYIRDEIVHAVIEARLPVIRRYVRCEHKQTHE